LNLNHTESGYKTAISIFLQIIFTYQVAMEKILAYKDTEVFYTVEGAGNALVFLHGYLESSRIWDGFASRFSGDYKVICIDIPGHGKSPVYAETHQMSELAAMTAAVLDEELVNKAVVIGHSMGGYITMEFVSQFPERLMGYCLFHSTCFADSEEKKHNREREISLVLCDKKLQIVRTNIPKAFADSNIDLMPAEVEVAKEIAAATPDEGVIAILRGMMERKDHCKTLLESEIRPLLIWGRKDNYINEEVFDKLQQCAPGATIITLEDSGHMGFVEEADHVYTQIALYLSKL